MNQTLKDILGEVEEIGNLLKATFVDKDELVDLLITCVLAHEHLLIVGPPGTAKSELIKRFAVLCTGAGAGGARDNYFEYLLTRFTEPAEIFGPVNIAAFREGRGSRRETRGMLPTARIAFLDEVFKANSAILNALLTILNERIFYNGAEPERVPLICAVGATNTVPDDDDELAALYDRFLLRVWTDQVEEGLFPRLFQLGWNLEKSRIAEGHKFEFRPLTTTDRLGLLHQALPEVNLDPIAADYREVVRRIRAQTIPLSDRRVVKLLRLLAASALRDGRMEANPGDFWVLEHVWSNKDQIPRLQEILDPYVQAYAGEERRTEVPLTDVEVRLGGLDARRAGVRTDADFDNHLQELERLRKLLLHHSAGLPTAAAEEQGRRQALLQRVETLVDELMKLLEKTA